MRAAWTILHGGALGDLVLTLQLALRLPSDPDPAAPLRVISRVDCGDLSTCTPAIQRRSSDGLGLHWLYGEHDESPPPALRAAVAGCRVLSALGGPHTLAHQRLLDLSPAVLYGIDPRPRAGVERHITQQWQTQIEQQGLLLPKCVHQRPAARGLGVPESLRTRGRVLLAAAQPPAMATQPARAASEAAAAPHVVLHPGSGGVAKCWPLANLVALARQVHAAGAVPVFVLGPVEAERWTVDALLRLQAEFRVVYTPAPDDLVAMLAGAAAFVGNDAGPAHLAALLGTPTTVLFGPTAPGIWRPLGARVQVLVGNPEQVADWGLNGVAVAESLLAAVAHRS